MLASRGLIERWPGRGTYVTPNLLESIAQDLSGFAVDILRDRDQLETRTLSVKQIAPSGWIGRALAPAMMSDKLTHVRRLRLVSGQPVMVTDHYIPAVIDSMSLKDADNWLFFRSFAVEKLKIIPSRSEVCTQAIAAEGSVADLLAVPSKTPLLYCEKVFYDTGNQACECLVFYAVTKRWVYRTFPQLRAKD